MNIYYKCTKCKHENSLKTTAKTRVELAMQNGKSIQSNCTSCRTKNKVEVNALYAKKSKLILLISLIIFLLGGGFVAYYLMVMLSEMKTVIGIAVIASLLIVPSWIYTLFHQQEQSRVNSFNRTYVS